MIKLIHHVTTVVVNAHNETDRVRVLTLEDPDKWDLPPFTPGAHVDIRLSNGMVRQYSLCGNPRDRKQYRIAIQREIAGRGGSAFVHDHVPVGSILSLSLPRNHFPPASDASRHILIAGGIGITPFLPMIMHFDARGTPWELHYCTRTADETAFLNQLKELSSCRVYHDGGDPARGLDIGSLLARQDEGDHVYCCGPGGLIEAVRRAAAHWPEDTVHFEYFGSAACGPTGTDYEVELGRSGVVVPVVRGQSMLVALRAAGVEVEASCEAGVCLACKTPYLSGTPVHRDLIMTSDDRQSYITPCVSGCAGGRIVLDI